MVRIGFYAIVKQQFSEHGTPRGIPSVRTTARRPKQIADFEVPIFVSLELPNGLFFRPALRATIVVPEAAAPLTIDAAVQENIARAIQQQLGVKVYITPMQEQPGERDALRKQEPGG